MDYSKDVSLKERKKIKATKQKIKNKVGILVFRVLLAIFLIMGFAAIGIGIGVYTGIVNMAPKLTALKVIPEIFTTIVYIDKTGEEYDRFKAEENREYVTFDKIPQSMKDAVVAIEDERFYTHNGIDMKGIFRAIYVNLTTDREEGASTITQQLIKNNVMKINSNSYITKIQEQYLAVKFEKDLVAELGSVKAAKDHILEVYLNTIGLHHNLNGVQTAALFYFNKDVSELTLSESTVIAGITQFPTKYTPVNNPENNKVRRLMVLDKMLELKYITKTEYDEALSDDVYSRIAGVHKSAQVDETNIHSFYVDQVFEDVSRDLQKQYNISEKEANNRIYNYGYQIYIPLDIEMQKIVDDTIKTESLFPSRDFEISVVYNLTLKNTITDKEEYFERTGTVKTKDEVKAFTDSIKNELMGPNRVFVTDDTTETPQPQVAFILSDYHNGQVKAVSGGRGTKEGNRVLNRATQSERQPGSVFKVLASFAPALDSGKITAGTIIDDVPFSAPGGKPNWPSNHWGSKYRGLMTIREAIKDSANVVTVKNLYETSIDVAFNYLLNFGFNTLVDGVDANGRTDRTLSLALGGLTHGVTQKEVAAAYGTIANLGVYQKPIFYTKVLDHDGVPILDNTDYTPKQVLKEGNAYILTDLMTSVIKNGTGGKAKFKEIKMPIAGKTGTTTDTLDLTFVGYTPYYVGSVWLGYDIPKKIKEDKGYHMLIWSTIMEKVHADLPYKEFDKPANVISVDICKDSGLLPVPGLCDADPRGSRIITELFVQGTQPTTSCDVHKRVTIDSASNKIANQYCPTGNLVYRSGIVRKVPYTGTAFVQDRQYELGYGAICNLHGPNSHLETETPIVDVDNTEEPIITDDGNLPTDTNTPSTTNNNPTEIPTEKPINTVEPEPEPEQTPEPEPEPTEQVQQPILEEDESKPLDEISFD